MYTRDDQDSLAQLLEEGFMDRMKARGKQAMGAVAGAGKQLKGKAQQAAGRAMTGVADAAGSALGVDASGGSFAQKGVDLQKAGAKSGREGARQGNESKYSEYVSSATQSLVNDLSKLNMPIDDEAALIADVKAAITNHLTQVTGSGQLRNAKGQMGGKI